MNIYFMRHGETDWNSIRKIQGSTDIPLNQNGIDLAEKVSKAVYEKGLIFDSVYSSPLQRALKTAQIMTSHYDVEIKIDPRIKEFLFGQAEGVTYDELRVNPKFSSLKNWFLDPANYHAELGAESYEDFFGRINDFLETEIKPLEGKAENVLIVCHGGVVRGLFKVMCGWSIEHFAQVKIPNCGLNLVSLKDGKYSMVYSAKEL
ncbi:MAG: histidine phosphatase family protein [Treponema sp.]|nr:histidine phosphatase family protein [Treponema sp.]